LWVIFALLDPDPDMDPLTWLNPDPIRIRIRNTDVKYLGLGLEVAAESGHDVDEHVDAALSRVLLHAFRTVLHVADTAVVQRVPDWNKNVPFHYFREIVSKSL
jgi:hypothetical protein